jgi:hypothetical protein
MRNGNGPHSMGPKRFRFLASLLSITFMVAPTHSLATMRSVAPLAYSVRDLGIQNHFQVFAVNDKGDVAGLFRRTDQTPFKLRLVRQGMSPVTSPLPKPNARDEAFVGELALSRADEMAVSETVYDTQCRNGAYLCDIADRVFLVKLKAGHLRWTPLPQRFPCATNGSNGDVACVSARAINASGEVAGYDEVANGSVSGIYGLTAVLWKPAGSTYHEIVLPPVSPEQTTSLAMHVDEDNRAIGYAFAAGSSSPIVVFWDSNHQPIRLNSSLREVLAESEIPAKGGGDRVIAVGVAAPYLQGHNQAIVDSATLLGGKVANEQTQLIPRLPGDNDNDARGVNSKGWVIGPSIHYDANGTPTSLSGYLWRRGGVTALEDLLTRRARTEWHLLIPE